MDTLKLIFDKTRCGCIVEAESSVRLALWTPMRDVAVGRRRRSTFDSAVEAQMSSRRSKRAIVDVGIPKVQPRGKFPRRELTTLVGAQMTAHYFVPTDAAD